LADKNLAKFFDQVFNQEITQHKLKEAGGDKETNLYHKKPVEIVTKVTKRPYLKIMEKIRLKLYEKLRDAIGDQHGQIILEALNDRHIEQSIKKLMKDDKIRLLDEHSNQVYREQIVLAGHHDHHEDGVPVEEHGCMDKAVPTEGAGNVIGGGDFKKSMKTRLEMDKFDLELIEREVRDHMRRNNTFTEEKDQ
jgi:hypothetical protein